MSPSPRSPRDLLQDIREEIHEVLDEHDALLAEIEQAHTELTQAHANIDQLLAELKRQEGREAENQRLRDALEACSVAALATDDAQRIAREALAGEDG